MFRISFILLLFIVCTPPVYAQDVAPSEALEQSDDILQSAENLLGDVEEEVPPTPAKPLDPAQEDKAETIMEVEAAPPEIASSEEPALPASVDVRLEFKPQDEALSDAHIQRLRQDVVPRLRGQPARVVEVLAFASSDTPDESNVRRISLARALAVQEFLMGQDIDERQIYLRPLGSVADKGDALELNIRNR